MPDMLKSQAQESAQYKREAGVTSVPMTAATRKTLLEPGHEAEWAEINREEDEYRRREARTMSMAERIEHGQKLSQQAVALLAASIRGGHVSKRAFWS